MRTIIFAFLLFTELGLLLLAVVNVQPANLVAPPAMLTTPTVSAPFGIPLPVKPVTPPDNECPADNVRKQSCEARYLSST